MFDIKDKVFVFTGATGTLGSIQAESLLAAGAKVALLGRNQDLLNTQKKHFDSYLENIETFQVDVLNKAALENIAHHILARFGTVDGLINAVGGNLPGATIADDKTIFDLTEKERFVCKVSRIIKVMGNKIYVSGVSYPFKIKTHEKLKLDDIMWAHIVYIDNVWY